MTKSHGSTNNMTTKIETETAKVEQTFGAVASGNVG